MDGKFTLQLTKRDYRTTDNFRDAVDAVREGIPRIRVETIGLHTAVLRGDQAMLRIVAENIGHSHQDIGNNYKIEGPK